MVLLVVSVLLVFSLMVLNVLLSIQLTVQEWKTVFGVRENVNAILVIFNRERGVFAKD